MGGAAPGVPVPRRATYRLQLHAGFDFAAAARAVPYLARLGVSHVYCSPYLQAAEGSTHGYDVADPTAISEDLGGEHGHAAFSAAVRDAGLAQLLDIVPNHMSVESERNRRWWDVLADGRQSPYASWFDIDWDNPDPSLHSRVLLPVLGDHIGRALRAGEIRVAVEGGVLAVRIPGRTLPLNAAGAAVVLAAAAAHRGGEGSLVELVAAYNALPLAAPGDVEAARARADARAAVAQRCAALLAGDDGAAQAVHAEVERLNRDVAALDQLLQLQHYRLSFWRTALQHGNYRRFFDINTLAAVRAEDPRVFEESHALVLDLLGRGVLDGVRCDHVDGLRDPAAYLRRLRERAGDGAWILVEKILDVGESLPEWPVDGTTGYDFAADATGVLVDPDGEAPLTALWEELSAGDAPFESWAERAKRQVADMVLAGDVDRLARLLSAVCREHPEQRDHLWREIRQAVMELLGAMPVYRTYVDASGASSEDVRRVEEALRRAVDRGRVDPRLLEFTAAVLLRRTPAEAVRSPASAEAEQELAFRFQQVCSAVTAKGVEDTAFYRYQRFVALNEVGSSPGRWSLPVEAFHERNAAAQRWPQRLLATSTHDTKRSEDVRARLCVLSEIPGEWRAAVEEWRAHNAAVRRRHPLDAPAEYLYYQTLAGAWPLDEDRAQRYMEKATREAKQQTSWIDPDPRYDAAVRGFVSQTLADPAFTASVAAFVDRITPAGRANALAQTVLKLTSPGVPDIYQGCELWDLSLVDPDNRREVDYDARAALLDRVEAMTAADAMAEAGSGAPKLLVVQRLLALRRERTELFDGAYTPLGAEGPAAARVIAFQRGDDLCVLVPRLPLRLSRDGWGGTRVALPPGSWRNVLTGATAAGDEVETLLGGFPVAVLVREAA